MPKCQNTIMIFSLYRGGSCYQFFELWWMFLVGTRPVIFKEANGIGFVPWNHLQVSFQNWVVLQNFQVCQWLLGAAQCVFALGLYSGLCTESIRLTNLIRISCIHEFEDLIFPPWFPYLFPCVFGSNQLQSLQIFPYLHMHELLRLKHVQKDLLG